MPCRRLSLFALAAVAALPGLARAGEWGGIFTQVGVTSDYRYQGVSNSDGHSAVFAGAHYWRPDGWYAGVWVSEVDFNDPGGTSYEVDYYGGKNIRLGRRAELKLEAMYTAFPDNRTFGPTYDFAQAKVGLKRTAGKLTLGTVATFVPEASYRSGQAWRVEGEAVYQLTPRVKLSALGGRRWIARGFDRNYWSVGAAYTWKRVSFEAKYVGSDLADRECGYLSRRACDPALVGAIAVALPPVR